MQTDGHGNPCPSGLRHPHTESRAACCGAHDVPNNRRPQMLRCTLWEHRGQPSSRNRHCHRLAFYSYRERTHRPVTMHACGPEQGPTGPASVPPHPSSSHGGPTTPTSASPCRDVRCRSCLPGRSYRRFQSALLPLLPSRPQTGPAGSAVDLACSTESVVDSDRHIELQLQSGHEKTLGVVIRRLTIAACCGGIVPYPMLPTSTRLQIIFMISLTASQASWKVAWQHCGERSLRHQW